MNADDLNLTDEDGATGDIPDEALEAASEMEQARAMTWGCTSIWWCFPQG